MSHHPIQPLERDEQGVTRFKANAIVCYLLDEGGIDMNHLARKQFPSEDREQFAQLIGYSLSGFSELSYVSDETYGTAQRMAEAGETHEQARVSALEEMLASAREGVRTAAVALFRIHPDDLTDGDE